MLTETIRYEDFNGEMVSQEFNFNLSKAELIDLQFEFDDGLVDAAQNAIANEDAKTLMKIFREVILRSVGKRVENRFIKTQEIREDFEFGGAFSELYTSIIADEKKATAFLKGVIPKELLVEVEKSEKKITPVKKK